MATFEAQVNGLTGLGATLSASTTPTDAELDQFLKDGVLDVTSRCIAAKPLESEDFTRSTLESRSQYGLGGGIGKIISVVREAGTDADWRLCTQIPIGFQSRVTDVDSLFFVSKYNPGYVVGGDGSIGVFPVPAGSNNAYKIYYVNDVPVNSSDVDLLHSHSDINYFPSNKVYLVIIYAAIKSLEAKMASFTIDEEDTELVQAIALSLSSLQQQYDKAFALMYPQQARPQQQQQGAR